MFVDDIARLETLTRRMQERAAFDTAELTADERSEAVRRLEKVQAALDGLELVVLLGDDRFAVAHAA
ncbi:MAG: hypothetical protein S0880_00595 [Actinomycetota bacterium]|nr:hypothetical protein [Actinomycetota bacterium]